MLSGGAIPVVLDCLSSGGLFFDRLPSPADRSCYVGKPYSLGSDHPRLGRGAGDDLDRNAMDSLAARFSAAARTALVRTGAGHAGLLPAGVLLVVVCVRCLCATDIRRGRLYRGVRRI